MTSPDSIAQKYLQKGAGSKDGKKEGDRTGVGLFIPLPKDLASQFPSLAPDDLSPPHVTFLYVGDVSEEKESLFLETLQHVLSDSKWSTVFARLESLDHFVHPDKERFVHHMAVTFAQPMAELKARMRSALEDAGFEVKDGFPVYRPHVTLQYAPLYSKWEGPVPHGSWSFQDIEVWGLPKVHTISLGKPKVAANPIQVDKTQARQKAQEIQSLMPKHLRFGEPSKPLKEQRGFNKNVWSFSAGSLSLRNVRGEAISVHVLVSAKEMPKGGGFHRQYVSGGSVSLRHSAKYGTPFELHVFLNPNASPESFSQNKAIVLKELFSVLIHELTHVMDLIPKEEGEKGSPESYYNKPSEVRAFMQQIVDEVLEAMEKDAHDTGGWISTQKEDVDYWLRSSLTWARVEPALSPQNRRKILEAVGRAVTRVFPSLREKYYKEASSKYEDLDFTPPASVAKAAEKGLEYRRKQSDKAGLTPSEASKEGIGSGVQRAVNLKNRDQISPEVVRQMQRFFSRHEKNKSIDPKFKNEPWKDKGYVSWLLWGGDPGKAWADNMVSKMDRLDTSKEACERLRLAFMERRAARRLFQVSDIAQLRKDFLLLMKNTKILKDYDMAEKWADYLNTWRKKFSQLIEELAEEVYKLKLPNATTKEAQKSLRTETWDLYIYSSVPMERFRPGYEYHSKESLFASLQKELPKWEGRVKRGARKAWKALEWFVQWYTARSQEALTVENSSEENVTLEGFQVRVEGYNPAEDSGHMEMAKEGLKRYRDQAKRYLPELLQKQLPMVLRFNCKLEEGGFYEGRQIVLCPTSYSRDPNAFAHTAAHEMGHHLYKGLSKDAKDFWNSLITGNYGTLDLNEVLQKYGTQRSFWGNDKIREEDPIMYLQIQGLSHDIAYKDIFEDILGMDNLRKWLDEGNPSKVRVHGKPITGYAAKNNEEAFCEVIGRLVGYGPRALLEEVREWLKTVVPSAKTASVSADRLAFLYLSKR